MIVLCHRSRRLDVDSMSIAGEHPNEFTRLWEGNNSADRRLRLASGVAASHVEQTYATPRRFDVDRGTIDFLHAMSLTASSRARWIGRARVAGAEQHLALWSLKSRRLTTVSISAARQRNRRRLSTSSKTSRSAEGEPTARYERAPVPTAFTPFGARVRMIPVERLQMPAPLVLSVCRLDRVPYPATGATCAGAVRLPTAGPDGSPLWAAGTGAVRCVMPPKRIALEDGSSALLPVLVTVAVHHRPDDAAPTDRGCCWARGSASGSSRGRTWVIWHNGTVGRTWVIWHNGTVAVPLRADRPRRGRAPAFRKDLREPVLPNSTPGLRASLTRARQQSAFSSCPLCSAINFRRAMITGLFTMPTSSPQRRPHRRRGRGSDTCSASEL